MPVDKELLEILVCPVCKTSVREVNDGAGLKCGTCHRVYPVQNDIPVMIIDRAVIEEPGQDPGAPPGGGEGAA